MLNEIETIKKDNCILHICSNSIADNEQEILETFSNISFQMMNNFRR